MYDYLAATSKADLLAVEAELRALEAPVAILWGTDDPFFPIGGAHWLRDHLRSIEAVVEVEGGRVFWPEERPELLAGTLRVLWTRHP